MVQSLGRHAELFLPELRRALRDTSTAVRVGAVEAIRDLGPCAEQAVSELVVATTDTSADVRRRAITALAKIRPTQKQVIQALVDAINDPDPGIDGSESPAGIAAIAALGAFSPSAKDALPHLLNVIQGPGRPEARSFALQSAAKITLGSDSLVPLLKRVLRDPDERHLARSAAISVGYLGEPAKMLLPDLISLFRKEYPSDIPLTNDTRDGVLFAFQRLGSNAADAIPVLTECCLSARIPLNTRRSAFASFGSMGPRGALAVPFLIECLQRREFRQFETEIVRSLRQLGEPAVVPLRDALVAASEENKRVLIRAIGQLGRHGELALPVLEAESTTDRRLEAERAINQIRKSRSAD